MIVESRASDGMVKELSIIARASGDGQLILNRRSEVSGNFALAYATTNDRHLNRKHISYLGGYVMSQVCLTVCL